MDRIDTDRLLDRNALNFSGGPGALPAQVLEQAQQAIAEVPGEGLSILGISHRSEWFRALMDEAQTLMRELLGVPDDYRVVFLQGGSSLQFSMIPMNFARGGAPAYIASGYWSAKSIAEAAQVTDVRVLWDGRERRYACLPRAHELAIDEQAAYLHYVSNETVEGLQFHDLPLETHVPLVCDMSSDFLSKPVDASRFAMIYAHAQKNLGPAGITVAILSPELLARCPSTLPSMLNYTTHVDAGSIYNTPPVFAVYVLVLVARWLRDRIGGVTQMACVNEAKARLVYDALAACEGFYAVHAARQDRSTMNVAFRLRDDPHGELERRFFEACRMRGLTGLEGHRSLGGMRASLYNAVSPEAAAVLAEFLTAFAQRHG